MMAIMELWISAIMKWFSLEKKKFVSHPLSFSHCTVSFVYDRDLHVTASIFFLVWHRTLFFTCIKNSQCLQTKRLFFLLRIYHVSHSFRVYATLVAFDFLIAFEFTFHLLALLLILRHTDSWLPCACHFHRIQSQIKNKHLRRS